MKMKEMKNRDAVTAICWVILGFIISIWSATFPFGNWESLGPAFFPLACGLGLILVGSILFVQALKQSEREPTKPSVLLIPHGAAFTRVALSLGGMLVSSALFDLLGFVLTVFCLTLFLIRAVQPQKWGVDIFYTTVFTIGSYVLFQVLLKITLPHGFLGL